MPCHPFPPSLTGLFARRSSVRFGPALDVGTVPFGNAVKPRVRNPMAPGTWPRPVLSAGAAGTPRMAARADRAAAAELALVSLADAAATGLSSREVLERVTEAAETLAGPATVHIWLGDPGGEGFRLCAASGARPGRQDFPLETIVRVDEGLVGRIAQDREPLVVTSLRREPHLVNLDWARDQGFVSFVGVPLARGERLLGVLGLFTWQHHRFTRREVSLLRAFAAHAAVALENARLFEALTRADHELQAAQERLVRAEKLRALGELAAGVAHDFNNLLGVILTRVEMARRQIRVPRVSEWLRIAEQAAQDGAQIVRQIREFTRGQHRQPVQAIDLNQVARDAVEMTESRWRRPASTGSGAIEVVTELGDIPSVDGQPAELREALLNLIANAADALGHGGRLRIVTRQAPDGVEVRVSDTGHGMSKEVQRRIFEPFFSTKGPRGAGLGLAMVYGIVSRHRGTITVDSVEGAGSTFTIHLPVGRQGPSLPVTPAGVAGPSKRVLIIDDNPTAGDALADMLRLQHYEVEVAGDGVTALAHLRARPFDVVLTDLTMPGQSGWEVARAIRSSDRTIPIAVLTGTAVDVSAEALQAHGIDAILTKPVGFEDLRSMLGRLRRPGRDLRRSGATLDRPLWRERPESRRSHRG